MATRQEIIDVIDAFLESRITRKEALEWAQKELGRTPVCEDPAITLPTILSSNVPEEVMERPLKEQLLLDREVLVHGVPCPEKELGKTIEAYWLAFTPWERIVLCQIKMTKGGERILEVIEEGWDGTQIFQEEIPLPYKDGNDPPLTWKKISRRMTLYRIGLLTPGRYLQWVIDQLQRRSALDEYPNLLSIYWELRRPKIMFSPEYIECRSRSVNWHE